MDHTRHIGIFTASGLNVTLVGAGGIGAMTALVLAKIGVGNLTVYDGDTVSDVNLPTQLHRLGTEGEYKVEALQKTLCLFGDDTNIFPVAERIDGAEPLSGQIIISAVDSISARKQIWKAVRAGHNSWYLDGRMSAEEFHLYAVKMTSQDQVAKYDRMITDEDDQKISELPCTSKATFYCSALSSAIIGRTVRQIATGCVPPYYYVQNLITDFVMSIPGEDHAGG